MSSVAHSSAGCRSQPARTPLQAAEESLVRLAQKIIPDPSHALHPEYQLHPQASVSEAPHTGWAAKKNMILSTHWKALNRQQGLSWGLAVYMFFTDVICFESQS